MDQRYAHVFRRLRHLLLAVGLLAGLAPAWQPGPSAASDPRETAAGVLEHETQSEFSRIRIRKLGTVRSMIFVRDSGEEALESSIDLRQPHVLQFEYLKFLFTSYLLRPQQEVVLIVGLGAGGMIHFLRHVDPELRIDAVEIDPVVVKLAAEYFNTRSGVGVNVVTGDGLKFLAETGTKYDVIYVDAFLKPSAGTDDTGAPLKLRTLQFYKMMQSKLKPGGLVAFNLNPHANLVEDLKNVGEAFPQAYVFPLVLFGGAVALGSTEARRVDGAELERRGRELDRRFGAPSMSFHEMSLRLRR